ncbi:cell envelope integrity protein TolA [Ramlibacter sp. AW1]|uniref:Cell envelope integrity protein TolA n=1 Tax=Ramlibacter aurantiacus TaxID=2801330 RepID=A0A936ZFB2_9BURK|nr:cell envelope integrity protein TolA [Ramlibacter aurantiacus]MBL0420474.1 cell envelope integrity protein TolA [Ramlibacter aurantiacus]
MAGPSDRYAPPPPPGRARSVGLAVLVHLVLVGALTWGVNWRDDPDRLNAEAELWAANVQQAAPREIEAPPPPPPPPPAPAVQAPPPPPPPNEADIALQREKERAAAEEKRRQEQLQAERERQKRQEAERLEKEKEKRLEAERAEARKRELAEQRKREEEKQRLAAEQKKREEAKRREAQEQQEARRMEQLREENLRRMQGLAGASGGPTATGTAMRSTGPSDSYAGRIRARVKPNIVFTDLVAGNPSTEVEVRMAPDGTITARRITKSSGVPSWDEAVLRALDRTQVLPRDLDGRVHSPLMMEFRPKG